MIVQMYDVRIPDATTRFRRVPAYDIPILRRMWASKLKPDAMGNMPVITATPLGQFEARNLFSERQRLIREYPITVDNGERPVWQEVYPTVGDFDRAYADELAVSARAQEAARGGAAVPPTATQATQQAVLPAAPALPQPGNASLFAPPTAARTPKRRGRKA